MEERSAHEAIIAGDDSLRKRKARKRGEEEEGVLGSGKSKSHHDHVDDRVDGLIVLMTPQHNGRCDKKLEEFLDSRPDYEGEVLARRLESAHELWVRSNVGGSKLLEWDNESDGNRASKKGERNEAFGLWVGVVFS